MDDELDTLEIVLSLNSANWAPGELVGLTLVLTGMPENPWFTIVDTTATQITVRGWAWPYVTQFAIYDLRLSNNSPAIDAGFSDATVPATDRDGLPRVDDPTTTDTGVGTLTYIDIGAYEYQ